MPNPVTSVIILIKQYQNEKPKPQISVLIIFSLVTLLSCQKEAPVGVDLVKRSLENEDIEWLIDFQSYLYALQENQVTIETYTAEEAVYGIEALLNIRYSQPGYGMDILSLKDSFAIQINSNWFDLFSTSHAIITDSLNSSRFEDYVLSAFDLAIYNIDINYVYFSARSIYKDTIESHFDQYTQGAPTYCGFPAFEEYEIFYLWLGGTYNIPLFLPQWLDCEIECGSYEPGETAAMEEIENRININYPRPDCGPGRYWTGKFVNIVEKYSQIEWSYGTFTDCGLTEEDHLFACDCLDNELLDCMLCVIADEIESFAAPIAIPQGRYFINIDLGIAFIIDDPIEEAQTRIDIQYFYGVPVCASSLIIYTEDVLEMELEDLICC